MYSKDNGIIRCVAKGVKKPKSKLGGRMDLLINNNLLVSKGKNLDIVSQAEVLNSFKHIRLDFSRLGFAMYCAELIGIFGSENDPNSENIYKLFDKEKFDLVVNFAAESHVDRSIEDPGIFLKTNILGTQVLMDASIKYNVKRFHQVGTDEVYGDLPLDRPVPEEIMNLVAPTEVQADGLPLKGQVNDPIARLLNGGNSGNAGVFSNAEDLAVIAAALLNGGAINGKRILSPLMIEQMIQVPEGIAPGIGRALGWDNCSGAAGPRGDLTSRHRSICHTGYTGPSMTIDFDNQLAVILLCNRCHPEDKGGLGRTRGTVANVFAASIVK